MFEIKNNLFARAAIALVHKAKSVGGANKNYILLMALAGVLEHAHASVKQLQDTSPQGDSVDTPQPDAGSNLAQTIDVAVENTDLQQAIQEVLSELAQTDPAIQAMVAGQLNLVVLDPLTGKPCNGESTCSYAIGQDGGVIHYEDGQTHTIFEQEGVRLYAQAETGVVTDAATSAETEVKETAAVAAEGNAGNAGSADSALSTPTLVALGALGFAAALGGGGGGSVAPTTPTNNAPTAVTISASTVVENAAGAIIGNLAVTDPDAGNTHTFAVDDARFEIVSGQLKLKAGISLDHEAASSVNVVVTATDGGGLSKAQAFVITVTDVAETTSLVGTEGADTISFSAGLDDFVITTLAGNDTINTGGGNDIIRPGEGADTVSAGAGNDIIVVVGQTAAGEYTQSDITNPGGSGIDLSSLITLADLNDRAVSEVVSGESIDGGAGTNRLVIYGNVDLAGVALSNVTQFQVNSTLTLSAQQLNALDLSVIYGDGESVLNIGNSGADPVVVDLSGVSLSQFRTLNVAAGVTLILDQADVDSLHYLSGEGALKASAAAGNLDLSGKYVSIAVQDKDGNADATFGGGIHVAGEVLVGSEAGEVLTGSADADRLEGGAGNDTLIGGDGNDVLRGGAGVDSMDGGAGDDTFVVVGDLSAGGKVDSVADSAALGFPLTDLNGQNLNEDEDGAVETIRGGDGDDTLYVYGTADIANDDITGIEHLEIRSHVTLSKALLTGNALKSITGDGSSTIRIEGGTAGDPLILDLTAADALKLGQLGQIDLGPNVILKIASIDALGGARILTGDGKVVLTDDAGELDSSFSLSRGIAIEHLSGSSAVGSAEVLDHEISPATPYSETLEPYGAKAIGDGLGFYLYGSDGDDLIQGSAKKDVLVSGDGNDVLSGKDGNDIYQINGIGTKTIIDSSGIDTLDLSRLETGATVNLTDGGTVGATSIVLGSGSAATSKLALDMFVVEDLSGSFSDDVATVRGLLDNLVAQVRDIQPNSQFGAGSFVDKPAYPYGAPDYGDYVYRTDAKINNDEAAIKTAFDNMVVLNGYDGPEAQLEALYQIALRTIRDDGTGGTSSDEIGFRPGSMRFVVLATDAPYHQAGDYASAGPNNGDTVLDGTPPGSGEDYPSVENVKAALSKTNIYPIFAVAGGAEASYQDLVSQLGKGDVVSLSWDSSNLINSIKTGLADYKADFIENLVGTNQADNLTGNSLDNRIEGGGGDDVLVGSGGSDVLVGGQGYDKAIYSDVKSNYAISSKDSYIEVVDSAGAVDRLYGIEEIEFQDNLIKVGEIPSKDLLSSSSIFGSSGYYKFFAKLALASYASDFDMESKPSAATDIAAYNYINNLDGFRYLSSSDLSLSVGSGSFTLPVIAGAGELEFGYQFSDAGGGGIANGVYDAFGAQALVGRSADSLFLAFRGTDSKYDIYEDFVGMGGHFDRFAPLIKAVDEYVAAHPDISHVYVTGHSLGGAMAEAFMMNHIGDKYSAITFEGAPYSSLGGVNTDNRIVQFEFSGDVIPDLGTNSGYVVSVEDGSAIEFSTPFVTLAGFGYHKMALSYELASFMDDEGFSINPTGAGGELLTLGVDVSGINVGDKDDIIEYTTILKNFMGISKLMIGAVSASPSAIISSMLELSGQVKGGWNQLVNSERTIAGGHGDDVLFGGDLRDTIIGGEGNDSIAGGGGNDVLSGGDGNDVMDEPNSIPPSLFGAIAVGFDSLKSDWEDIFNNPVSEGVLTSSFDSLFDKYTYKFGLPEINGIVFNKEMALSAFSGIKNWSKGLLTDYFVDKGVDAIGEALSWRVSGNDILQGGKGDDIYFVDGKQDVVVEKYGEGFDALIATGKRGFDGWGAGDDGYILPDNVEVGILKDDVWTASENFALSAGGSDKHYLIGNAGNNVIRGGDGADFIAGGGDEDRLYGGAGDDVITGGKYDALFSSLDESEIPLSVRSLIDKYADAAALDNQDVSYLRGGLGKDHVYGSMLDNDFFLVDVDLSNNVNNVDVITDFYIAHALSDASAEDYLVFSSGQLGIAIDDIDAIGSLGTSVNGKDAYYVSSLNFMTEYGIDQYAKDDGMNNSPQFILDTKSGGLWFDKDGSHDVGDQVLLANISAAGYGWATDLEKFDADQILVMTQANFDLV